MAILLLWRFWFEGENIVASKKKNLMNNAENNKNSISDAIISYRQNNRILAEYLFIHQKESPYYSADAEQYKNLVNNKLISKIAEITKFIEGISETEKKVNIDKIEQYIYYLCLKNGLNGEQLLSLNILKLNLEEKIGMLNSLIEKEINLQPTKTQKFIADYKELQKKINAQILTSVKEKLSLNIDSTLKEFEQNFSQNISKIENFNVNNNIKLDFSEIKTFLDTELEKTPKLTKNIREQLEKKVNEQMNSKFWYNYKNLTKQMGFAFEEQVSQELKSQELILSFKENFCGITERSGAGKVTGASKHSRTRKVDMNLFIPEIKIKPRKKEIVFTGNTISIQHSIKRTQADKAEIHFHTAKNLQNLISFLLDNCFENKNLRDFLQEIDYNGDPYYSYFLVNDIFTTKRIDGTVFLKSFRKMLASFGPIYALSTLTKSITTSKGEVDDSIDVVLVNNKLIPASTLFSLYINTLKEKGSNFIMNVDFPKKDLNELQNGGKEVDIPPPYYTENYLSKGFNKRKDFFNNIEFGAKLTESFRQKINNYIDNCIKQYQGSYAFKQLNKILEGGQNG